ncbi:transcription factor 24-like [Centruroides vittatus]|uniref:transcription factor 24-like n=1 Tax=Centruroides vittatus TaxID=120091 RepID=UPI00350F8BEF
MNSYISYETSEFIEELSRLTSTNQTNFIKDISKPRKRSRSPAVSRNAARERTRVKSLRNAFLNLQRTLPYVPPNTKLSKLDVLILATTYISHLMKLLNQDTVNSEAECPLLSSCSIELKSPVWESSYLHPVKKWPMRSRLYAGVQEDSTNLCLGLGLYQEPTDNVNKRQLSY